MARPYSPRRDCRAAQGQPTVANTGITAKLVPATKDAEQIRALVEAYADSASHWQHLCDRLSLELKRLESRKCGRCPRMEAGEVNESAGGRR
jgi:hypothetical protein